MTRAPRWRIALSLAATLSAASAATIAEAQLLLPFDLGQGAAVNAGGAMPYVASAKLQAAVGIGTGAPLRVGPVAAVRYANPEWIAAAGLRAQWMPLPLKFGARRIGLGLAAEQLWGTDGHGPAALGVLGEFELLRLGAWLTHDWETERTGFELSLGTDLRSLASVLWPPGDPKPFEDIP